MQKPSLVLQAVNHVTGNHSFEKTPEFDAHILETASPIAILLSLLFQFHSGVSKTTTRDGGRGRGRRRGRGWSRVWGVFLFSFLSFAIYLELDSFWTKKYLSIYNGKSFKEITKQIELRM